MLAITQCGVEYNDLIVHVCFLPDFCTFVQVNRLLPVFRYKKTRILMRVLRNWCGYFSSTAYPRELVTIRRRLSRIEK
ncbi:hypothetical protein F6W79_02845 [Vibrio diabolicus]|uniref:Uncharacterized protein n=2 Tax=Vibrio TaxID=662 RepID=A0AAX1XTX9_9VIBR|nr:hypothetical protein AL537_06375 [Vibrio diabolicus]NKJ69001.1 hypothetical protein [Vibrio chemaguriensis]KAB0321968.1 hypothetical protein F6W79_02845 [Vibrio diabolicus]NVC48787.1 hypothetical protein [Vibrio diabolicus]RPB43218.1 hypothetical protein CYQ91_01595 [Vibrio diabolicus]